MRFYIYSLKDELQNRFKQPTFFSREEEAARWFSFVINEDKFMRSNPADFGLYHIGFFDDETGIVEYVQPTKQVNGLSVKKGDE